jgi:hypothetical protein
VDDLALDFQPDDEEMPRATEALTLELSSCPFTIGGPFALFSLLRWTPNPLVREGFQLEAPWQGAGQGAQRG